MDVECFTSMGASLHQDLEEHALAEVASSYYHAQEEHRLFHNTFLKSLSYAGLGMDPLALHVT
jgi:hypothetical protein